MAEEEGASRGSLMLAECSTKARAWKPFHLKSRAVPPLAPGSEPNVGAGVFIPCQRRRFSTTEASR